MAKELPNCYRSVQWLMDEYELRLKAFKLGKERGEYGIPVEYAKKVALNTVFKAEIDALAEKIKSGELDGSLEVPA